MSPFPNGCCFQRHGGTAPGGLRGVERATDQLRTAGGRAAQGQPHGAGGALGHAQQEARDPCLENGVES